MGQPAVAVHLADEIAQHGFGDVEIGDHAVFERAYRGDAPGRAAEHLLGHQAHRLAVGRVQHSVGAFTDGDHGGLVQDDTLPLDTDQGVAGSQVNAHVNAEESGQAA